MPRLGRAPPRGARAGARGRPPRPGGGGRVRARARARGGGGRAGTGGPPALAHLLPLLHGSAPGNSAPPRPSLSGWLL